MWREQSRTIAWLTVCPARLVPAPREEHRLPGARRRRARRAGRPRASAGRRRRRAPSRRSRHRSQTRGGLGGRRTRPRRRRSGPGRVPRRAPRAPRGGPCKQLEGRAERWAQSAACVLRSPRVLSLEERSRSGSHRRSVTRSGRQPLPRQAATIRPRDGEVQWWSSPHARSTGPCWRETPVWRRGTARGWRPTFGAPHRAGSPCLVRSLLCSSAPRTTAEARATSGTASSGRNTATSSRSRTCEGASARRVTSCCWRTRGRMASTRWSG